MLGRVNSKKNTQLCYLDKKKKVYLMLQQIQMLLMQNNSLNRSKVISMILRRQILSSELLDIPMLERYPFLEHWRRLKLLLNHHHPLVFKWNLLIHQELFSTRKQTNPLISLEINSSLIKLKIQLHQLQSFSRKFQKMISLYFTK